MADITETIDRAMRDGGALLDAAMPPEKSDGQKFLDRLAALRDSIEASAGALEQIAASVTGQAAPARDRRIIHPFSKPVEGFVPAADSALTHAERDARTIAETVKTLQKWF